ncbi:unnamed protein product, partial [marine sediment metagenome]
TDLLMFFLIALEMETWWRIKGVLQRTGGKNHVRQP